MCRALCPLPSEERLFPPLRLLDSDRKGRISQQSWGFLCQHLLSQTQVNDKKPCVCQASA